MLYLQLFLSFFKIGLFGFGGGLAILSLIQHEVEANAWMSQSEFVDIVAISQVTPGPIGINCATYVGYTATGSIFGSMLATFAIILPSLIIMLSVCRLYLFLSTRFQTNPYFQNTLRMLRFAVIGLIAAAALLLITPDSFIDWKSWLFFAVVFFFTVLPELTKRVKNSGAKKLISTLSHPILLIVLAGIAGYLVY
ncbi:MAG: chromate transporter [Paludibacteraceae bacterium]